MDIFEFVNPWDTTKLRREFVSATPFPHVVIEDFFTESIASELISEFPMFSAESAVNEFGEIGRKATHENLTSLGFAFQKAHELFSSTNFIRLLEEVTEVEGLIFDPLYFGGGTHENLSGQSLDPHVDFNYHPVTGLLRRLNLLVYLNKDWLFEYGGNLELFRDPRISPKPDVCVVPNYNRAVIFETSERSWHGFEKINLNQFGCDKPPSRKSISVYYYSEGKSSKGRHSTFYVQRPLPKRLIAGTVLTPSDEVVIKEAIASRDTWIHHYQELEAEMNQKIDHLQEFQYLPISGPVQLLRKPSGWWTDHWVARRLELEIQVVGELTGLRYQTYLPKTVNSFSQQLMINGKKIGQVLITHGINVVSVGIEEQFNSLEILKLTVDSSQSWNCNPEANDNREVSFLMSKLHFLGSII